MQSSIFTRRHRRIITFLLLPALLFALGLRICLHVDSVTPLAPGQAHAAALHLESTLIAAGDHDESSADVDVSLDGLLSLIVFSLAFIVTGLTLYHDAPVQSYFQRLFQPALRAGSPQVYLLSPPLRAPPR
jgi:hypothetical protein